MREVFGLPRVIGRIRSRETRSRITIEPAPHLQTRERALCCKSKFRSIGCQRFDPLHNKRAELLPAAFIQIPRKIKRKTCVVNASSVRATHCSISITVRADIEGQRQVWQPFQQECDGDPPPLAL